MTSAAPELVATRVKERLVVRGGTLLDGTRADIEIVDGRIAALGTVTDPTSARSIDATGCWIAPGLVDAHAHVVAAAADGSDEVARSVAVGRGLIRSALAMRDLLDHGVTTLGSACGPISAAQALRVVRLEGIAAGPRLSVLAGVSAAEGDGSDNEDAVRLAARRSFGFGADLLAIGECGDDDQGLAAPQMAAVIDEARRRGATVFCRSERADTVRAAVLAGVDTVVGIPRGDDQLIDLLVAHKVRLVPLVAADESAERLAFVRHAAEAGLGIAAGSGGVDLATELAGLRAAGLTHDEVLRAAGPIGAKVLGLGGEVGAIAAGLWADLLIVDTDPRLDALAMTRPERLRFVLVGGD